MNIEIRFDKKGKIIPSYKGNDITMEDSPYMIFLSTVGMCSAVYVRAFLNQRNISLEGVSLTQKIEHNPATNMVEDVGVIVNLSQEFPSKYNNAIKSVIHQCPVKKHLVTPPSISVNTSFDLAIEV